MMQEYLFEYKVSDSVLGHACILENTGNYLCLTSHPQPGQRTNHAKRRHANCLAVRCTRLLQYRNALCAGRPPNELTQAKARSHELETHCDRDAMAKWCIKGPMSGHLNQADPKQNTNFPNVPDARNTRVHAHLTSCCLDIPAALCLYVLFVLSDPGACT